MTTCVVGLGHIGLPTALLLAQNREVVGVDIDPEVVETLDEGELPFEEPGMTDLFETVQDRISVHPSLKIAQDEHPALDAYLIATPTPLDEVTQVPNLDYLRAAVESVAEVLSPGDLVIVESTVPPGTSERLVAPILQASPAGPEEFNYAYCPERALPGDTIHEMIHNDRVVGGDDPESRKRAIDLYGFVEGTIYSTNPRSAEFIKLIENTYRDVNIALANELGKLAELYGLDGRAAIEIANEHPRVNILSPGPGVGGHCLPIDPQFLTQLSETPRLISLAREINDTMPVHVLRLVRDMVAAEPGIQITILGVAYKGGVDDTRGTPARRFLRLAENEGYDVHVHDPHVTEFDRPIQEFERAIEGSDCLVLMADHPEYADINPTALSTTMRRRNILDTRDMVERQDWEDAGFNVRTLGDGS